MPKGKRNDKSLDDLSSEIEKLKQEVGKKDILLQAEAELITLEKDIFSLKEKITQNGIHIKKLHIEKKDLEKKLRQRQTLKRKQVRIINDIREDMSKMERRLGRRVKELNERFNPSSRKMG